jgi:hypothetical protein
VSALGSGSTPWRHPRPAFVRRGALATTRPEPWIARIARSRRSAGERHRPAVDVPVAVLGRRRLQGSRRDGQIQRGTYAGAPWRSRRADADGALGFGRKRARDLASAAPDLVAEASVRPAAIYDTNSSVPQSARVGGLRSQPAGCSHAGKPGRAHSICRCLPLRVRRRPGAAHRQFASAQVASAPQQAPAQAVIQPA